MSNQKNDWLYASMQEVKRDVESWPAWQRDAMNSSVKKDQTSVRSTKKVEEDA